jgi:hypothetical protein
VIDYEKSARVMMFDKATLLPAFDVVVYGVTPEELMRVPHPAIHALAQRFPDHQSSPFHVKPMPRPKPWPRAARPPRPFAGGSDE